MNSLSGLYLHLPFCVAKCFYCDFPVKAGQKRDTAGYTRALIAEMEQKKEMARGQNFSTLYFGGGTPSLCSIAEISSLLETARSVFSWTEKPEITIEANPASLTLEDLRSLHAMGVNRLSLGAQSFSDDILRRLGRNHRSAGIAATVAQARSAGFDNLNLDLIYGVPRLDMAEWERTVQTALSLHPEHLSVYNLTLEEDTTFGILARKGRFVMPSEEDQVTQAQRAREMLLGAGYLHYEISNYARPGSECRHNLIYWQNGNYLGCGMAAHSLWNGKRSWNTLDLDDYVRRVTAGKDPREGEEILDQGKQMREAIFLGLRLVSRGIVLDEFRERFGQGLEDLAQDRLNAILEQGLVVREEGTIRLTPAGLPLADEIAVQLF